jgi:hypothetical protein
LNEHRKPSRLSIGASVTSSWHDNLKSSAKELSFMRPDFVPSIQSLDDYLGACWRTPWAWGVMDCCQFGGGWVRSKTGRDPLHAFNYRSAIHARRLVIQGGGLVKMVDEAMGSVGFARTTAPDHGDLGVIDGRWWIGRDVDGLVYFEPNDVVAWRIG